jgi:hypothetical protein
MAQVETAGRTLDCGHPPSEHTVTTMGYVRGADGRTYCYDCCADRERAAMIETGRATLYLTIDTQTTGAGQRITRGYVVTDWPGRLRFPARYVRTGRHNIARVRRDFDFTGPDGFRWVGVQYGDNTEIAHCRRTKQVAL